jgi:universal stress protein A
MLGGPPRSDSLLTRVLVPTDFSSPSDQTLEEVITWPDDEVETVTLLHVLEEKTGTNSDTAREKLNERKSRVPEELRTKLSTVIRTGAPVREILLAAESEQSTLIAMARQGRGMLSEVFVGGVSNQVARQAPCPVLLTATPDSNLHPG